MTQDRQDQYQKDDAPEDIPWGELTVFVGLHSHQSYPRLALTLHQVNEQMKTDPLATDFTFAIRVNHHSSPIPSVNSSAAICSSSLF